METMEKVNIFSQMAQYDFSTPINVTMTFEDSDDESSNKNALKDQIKNYEMERKSSHVEENKEPKKNESVGKNVRHEEEIRIEDRTEDKTPVGCQNDSSSTKENAQTTNNPVSTTFDSVSNRNSVIINNNPQEPIEKAHHNISNIYEQLNDKEELTAYVKDLLNTLSEHLILIMRAYYNFYYKKHTMVTAPDLATQLTQLKTHFYDLSYSTIVTLILPQENNGNFIKQFLEKTATEANKVFRWKCEQHHVKPFFDEMIAWTKHKKEYIKSIGSQQLNNSTDRMNENRILKERLAGPPQPFHISHLNGSTLPSQNNNNKETNSDNTMCIFSYGSPGREISINVNTDTLLNHSAPQHQSYDHTKQISRNEVQQGNNITYRPNNQPVPRKAGHHDSRVHRLQHNYYSQSKTVHHKPVQHRLPPPPYGTPAHNMPATMPENYHYNSNQIHDNIAQAVRNYQLQNNINPYTIPNNSNFSETYGGQTENQVTTPIITSVTSLNPKSTMTNRRCSMCGKTTNTKCSVCNKVYCSYLCKAKTLAPEIQLKLVWGPEDSPTHIGTRCWSS